MDDVFVLLLEEGDGVVGKREMGWLVRGRWGGREEGDGERE